MDPERVSGALDRAQAALEALSWKIEREPDLHSKSPWIGLWPPA
jgi:hypothetical protein